MDLDSLRKVRNICVRTQETSVGMWFISESLNCVCVFCVEHLQTQVSEPGGVSF